MGHCRFRLLVARVSPLFFWARGRRRGLLSCCCFLWSRQPEPAPGYTSCAILPTSFLRLESHKWEHPFTVHRPSFSYLPSMCFSFWGMTYSTRCSECWPGWSNWCCPGIDSWGFLGWVSSIPSPWWYWQTSGTRTNLSPRQQGIFSISSVLFSPSWICSPWVNPSTKSF